MRWKKYLKKSIEQFQGIFLFYKHLKFARIAKALAKVEA
jgi:hypothetical protein